MEHPMEHTAEGYPSERRPVLGGVLAATDQDGRPGRTPGQAEGLDPDEPQEGEGQDSQDSGSQATPDQAEGEDEDA